MRTANPPSDGSAPSTRCAACHRPVEHADAGADVRLYLGPGDKLVELWLPLCDRDVERFREAHQVLVECQVGHVSSGGPEAER